MPEKLYPDAKTAIVRGDGPVVSPIMIIGEAPGAEEDEQGKPFVGRAGKKLNEALASAELERSACYVTNLVKCRPPGNRTPTKEEIGEHLGFFVKEFKIIRPKFVLILGNTVLHTLTNIEGGIMSNRGIIPTMNHAFSNRSTVFATVHPSAALRSPQADRAFHEDVKAFAKLIDVRTQDPS